MNKYEKAALDILRSEKEDNNKRIIYVSDDVTFDKKSTIDTARKNYYGVFQEANDSDTGMEKLWVPITEWLVERMVGNVDLDTKDIHVKNSEGRVSNTPIILRLVIFNFLKKMGFGEWLNDFIRRLTIDGVGIAKVYKAYSEKYKRDMPVITTIDPLNFIIDESSKSIQDSESTIEIHYKTKAEIDRISTNWSNKDEIEFSNDDVPISYIYERYGYIPKALVSHKKKDWKTWIPGVIIASAGIDYTTSNDKTLSEIKHVHMIKSLTSGIKPYEECWLKRVPNRWHGRGIPEQVKGIQEWLNTVINIRRNELLNKLVGKYKIRKGSGITRQMIQSLSTGGAIPVDNMDDIQELRESDIQSSSYTEPVAMEQMAEKVTGAMSTPTDPSMQSTTAVIQERGVKTLSNLVQENIGLFLERLFEDHIIPTIIDCLKEGEVIRITGDADDLAIIDEAYARYMANTEKMSITEARTEVKKKFEGKEDRPLQVYKSIFDPRYDVDIYVTAERFDPQMVLKNLNDFMISYGRLPNADINVINDVTKEYLSTLELPIARRIGQNPQGALPRNVRPEAPTGQGMMDIVNQANIEGVTSPREQ